MKQTNQYAEEVLGEKYSSWKAVSAEEVHAFLEFSILMGVVSLPSLDDYWSCNTVLHYSPVADRITRDRFREISCYLHFVDNSTLILRGSPGHDRLGKVRPVVDYVSSKCREIYDPHCEVAVDEAMIKFQGRSSLKQYMPKKPVKRGIKVWVLGDSHNGFFSDFEIYTGKEDCGETVLGGRVVSTLTRNLKDKYHHVFF